MYIPKITKFSHFITKRPSTELHLQLDDNAKLLLKNEGLSLTSILGNLSSKIYNYTDFSVHSPT